jgi:hypothetical protein
VNTFEDSTTPGYLFEVGKPEEFGRELAAIEALISSRDEVDQEALHQHLPHAARIAVARAGAGREIVSVCVLKGDRPEHNKRVARKSDYGLEPATPEMGYAATAASHERRGLNGRLIDAVLHCVDGAVYATCRMTNEAEQRNLCRRGFRSQGTSWKGRGDYQVGLWVRTFKGAGGIEPV